MPYVYSTCSSKHPLNRGIKNYPLWIEATEPRRQHRLIFQHSTEQVGCASAVSRNSNSLWESLTAALPAGPPHQHLPRDQSRGTKGSFATSLLRAG